MLLKLFIICILTISSSQSTDDADDINKNIPGLDMPIPSQEELLKMLDSIEGISDEEKANLRKDLFNNIKVEEIEPVDNIRSLHTHQGLLLFALLGLLTLIFVFFVYKLYKSLTERERQQQEKKRLKQMRKAK